MTRTKNPGKKQVSEDEKAADAIRRSEVGQRITALAEAKNLTRAEIARVLKVSKPTVAAWFDGLNYPGSIHIFSLASMLGTSPEYLLWGSAGAPEGGFPVEVNPRFRRIPGA